jgi:CTP:molybdopterin cytidylyltransferase MocA
VIAGLILAAGGSVRMGRPKIGLDVGGRAMLTRVADAALAAGLQDVVVVIAGADGTGSDAMLRLPADARAAIGALGATHGVRVVQNPQSTTGQASSLRVGLRAMRPEADAAIVLLADQPTIRADAIRAVAAAFDPAAQPVIQASYGGVPSHPTLLARTIWLDVAELEGDEGARRMIADHPEWRSLVEVGGEPPMDVDTPDDLRGIRSQLSPG